MFNASLCTDLDLKTSPTSQTMGVVGMAAVVANTELVLRSQTWACDHISWLPNLESSHFSSKRLSLEFIK